MFQHLIVPVDRSSASWRSVVVASRMAAGVEGTVQAVTVADRRRAGQARLALERGIADLGSLPIRPLARVITEVEQPIATLVAGVVDSTPGATVVMSSHGHGRSAVLGGTIDAVLRELFGPVFVVGPRCDLTFAGRLDGTYVVPLDGSVRADAALPIVAAWTVEFGGAPWLVAVVAEGATPGWDVVESAYVGHRAAELRSRIGLGVEYDVLHGARPARAIVDFAADEQSSLIFLTTHGRAGFGRLRAGSVAAEVVRRARCPVVLFRPPELRRAPADDRRPVEMADPPMWSREWCERYGGVDVTSRAAPRRALARSRR